MSFELTFSEEFFLAEGEPYDRPDLALNKQGKPISVYSAIQMIPIERYKALAREVFGMTDGFCASLTAEVVLNRIRETNTCTNLQSPVSVWIDKNGDYRVSVFAAD